MKMQERVINVVSEQLGVGANSITLESNFVNDLGADSLDIVEMVMALEEEFSVAITDEEAEALTTVAQVIGYIEKAQAA